jgi:hypothetical protein
MQEEEKIQEKEAPAQMMVEEEEEETNANNMPAQMQEDKEEEIQPKKGQQNPDSPTNKSVNSFAHLNMKLQTKMQNSFGTSFQDVNIHQNDGSASQMGALAYTQGNNVHFAPGQFNPNTQGGQELLGHELTHVVQQREGRVQPTKQGKGKAVNDNPSLESEADNMGKKAANGQQVDIAGKGSGVQKEGKNDPKVKDGKDGNPEVRNLSWLNFLFPRKVENVNVHAILYDVDTYEDGPNQGQKYVSNVKYVITTDEKNWTEILKYGNEISFQYIFGFIHAATKGYDRPDCQDPNLANNAAKGKPSTVLQTDSSFSYMHIFDDTPIIDNKDAILPFLNALYGIHNKNESSLDLPQSFWEASNHGVNFDTIFSGLGSFIKKYQHLLIENESNLRIDNREENIKKVAEQGTPSKLLAAGTPAVARAMVHNAFATALSAAKSLLNKSVIGINKDNFQSSKRDNYMVYNSALIINNAIKGYNSVIDQINKNRNTVFNSVWTLIPFSDKVPSICSDGIHDICEGIFNSAFKTSPDSIATMKAELKTEFSKLGNIEDLKKEKEAKNINFDAYLKMLFHILSAFNEGIDD